MRGSINHRCDTETIRITESYLGSWIRRVVRARFVDSDHKRVVVIGTFAVAIHVNKSLAVM